MPVVVLKVVGVMLLGKAVLAMVVLVVLPGMEVRPSAGFSGGCGARTGGEGVDGDAGIWGQKMDDGSKLGLLGNVVMVLIE